ncbi:unnamed protein product [Amoebophrya sp. A120]|nr:unnamed protein product [Amoebophrya sp. A120]|eukprot:GSA120T00005604001.1
MNASGGTKWPSDPNAYEMTTLIGTGASARVHIARTNDNRTCALKILDLEALANDDVLDEIRKELQAMALCRHPNIISHYVSFPYKRQMWLVMPLMPGGSAADLLRSQFPGGFKNDELGTVLHILYEISKALEYLHDEKNKQIHRDLKGANVLLGAQGEVCLADFGVAATLKEQRTRNTCIGTPHWMAPEVLQAGQSGAQWGYTQKADIWSLGITALELYNGAAPYQRQRLHYFEIMENILNMPPPVAPQEADPRFREFVSYCLQKNPSSRPRAKELIGAQNFGWERRSPDRLKAIIESLPPLEERTMIGQLAETSGSGASGGVNGQSGAAGQSGASEEWNFDLPEDETGTTL